METTVGVNEIYYPLIFNSSRYLVLLGGAGSGKSHFAAQKIIARCLEQKHRFLIIRKVSDTLKDSVFKLMTGLLGENGVLPLCEVNKTEKTILLPNGSEILMKGLDDPEKIKSIAGITGIWVEEATEITDADFDQLDLRLRGETISYKQIILTFNPIDERHWLKHRFFDSEESNCTTLKTTANDNSFIDEEYLKVLDAKASVSPNFYRVYKLGEWGKAEVKHPAAYNFNYNKHVCQETYNINYNIPVYFSQDFNVDPMATVYFQQWNDSAGHHIRFIDEIALFNSGVVGLVDRINRTFTPQLISLSQWTGDETGNSRNTSQQIIRGQHLTNWKYLDQCFNLGRRLRLPKRNPLEKDRLDLMNIIFALHPDLKFNPSMKVTINELQYTEVDEYGKIIKANRKDDTQRSDFLDIVGYAFFTWFNDFKDNPKKYSNNL